jgi:hypothetical protein
MNEPQTGLRTSLFLVKTALVSSVSRGILRSHPENKVNCFWGAHNPVGGNHREGSPGLMCALSL